MVLRRQYVIAAASLLAVCVAFGSGWFVRGILAERKLKALDDEWTNTMTEMAAFERDADLAKKEMDLAAQTDRARYLTARAKKPARPPRVEAWKDSDPLLAEAWKWDFRTAP